MISTTPPYICVLQKVCVFSLTVFQLRPEGAPLQTSVPNQIHDFEHDIHDSFHIQHFTTQGLLMDYVVIIEEAWKVLITFARGNKSIDAASQVCEWVAECY